MLGFCAELVVTDTTLDREKLFTFLNSSISAKKANVWRYEKLPIAGDFLSSYTKG
jgi:hypothetical protein